MYNFILSLCFNSSRVSSFHRHGLALVNKRDFHGSDGSLTGVPENLIDKWAFETEFGGIVILGENSL